MTPEVLLQLQPAKSWTVNCQLLKLADCATMVGSGKQDQLGCCYILWCAQHSLSASCTTIVQGLKYCSTFFSTLTVLALNIQIQLYLQLQKATILIFYLEKTTKLIHIEHSPLWEHYNTHSKVKDLKFKPGLKLLLLKHTKHP